MNNTLDWGLQVVLWFQHYSSPWLDLPFFTFTMMGEELFYLLVLPGLYWCINRQVGARLTLLFLLSAYLNAGAKFIFNQPRPFEYDPRVRQLATAPGGGLPSGHAQNAVVVWGYVATQLRRAWAWWLAGLLVVFISLSRLYLGVHFPTDLLGGHIIGAVLLGVFLWLEPSAETWLKTKGLIWHLGLALTTPLLLVYLFPTEEGVTVSAVMLGLGLGFALEQRWLGFEVDGPRRLRGLRFALGIGVMIGLWLGLRLAFVGWEPETIFRFFRYGLMGLWGALGAPWLFVRLGWAETGSAKKVAQTLVFTKNKLPDQK